MKFVTTDFSVLCIRETPNGDKEVVSFDIELEQIAPHVEAALFPQEIEELNTWLTARSRLKSHLECRDDELNVIDVLPSLLKEANDVLVTRGEIDANQKEMLINAMSSLQENLEKAATISETKPKVVDDLGRAEFLKAKLDVIKQDLSNNEID